MVVFDFLQQLVLFIGIDVDISIDVLLVNELLILSKAKEGFDEFEASNDGFALFIKHFEEELDEELYICDGLGEKEDGVFVVLILLTQLSDL